VKVQDFLSASEVIIKEDEKLVEPGTTTKGELTPTNTED